MGRFFIIILFLGIAVFLFVVQTNPRFDTIKVLKAEKESIDEALQYARELQTLRDDLLNKYNAISQEDIARLYKLLPAEVSSGDLITIFEERVKKYNLLLKKIDINEKEIAQDPSAVIGAPPPPYRTIDLSLNISGTYESFLLLLRDLEKSLRLIDISQINFSSGTGNVLEFNVVAHTYVGSSLPTAFAATGITGQNSEAREILTMLTKMKGISIDNDFFQSDVFRSLEEFVPVMTLPEYYGRLNPFKPLQ